MFTYIGKTAAAYDAAWEVNESIWHVMISMLTSSLSSFKVVKIILVHSACLFQIYSGDNRCLHWVKY